MRGMSRTGSSLVALVAALSLTLAACGNGDEDGVTTTTAGPGTTAASTTTTVGPATTAGATTSTSEEAPRARVSVTVDGQVVPLREICQGVDGAVVAIAAETGRRIILVREEGLALRIGTEGGTFSETDEVQTAPAGEGTRYSGTILVEGQPTPVTMEIAGEEHLDPCTA